MRPGERKLLRVLASGGMLISSEDGCQVYRTNDARRGCVGLLSREIFERLKTDRTVVQFYEAGDRWRWREGHALDLPGQGGLWAT